jgi:Tfp pilus assembly protein FimV
MAMLRERLSELESAADVEPAESANGAADGGRRAKPSVRRARLTDAGNGCRTAMSRPADLPGITLAPEVFDSSRSHASAHCS